MAGSAGMGEGDLPYRPPPKLKLEGAGDDGAFDPENEDLLEEDCFSLSIGGGGNMEAATCEGGNEGVDATEVAGVSGPASLLEFEPENKTDASSREGNSLAADSASLAVLSRLYSPGRLLARPDDSPSLTVLEVLACLRPDLDPPMFRLKFVFFPIA